MGKAWDTVLNGENGELKVPIFHIPSCGPYSAKRNVMHALTI